MDDIDNIVVGGYYRHFKGNIYHVINLGTHTETGETMVVYNSVSDWKIWVRPLSMFIETIERDGKTMKRFEYLGDDGLMVRKDLFTPAT